MPGIAWHFVRMRGTFSDAQEIVLWFAGTWRTSFQGRIDFSRLGADSNTTTRDRRLEHEVRKILCFVAAFRLTEFSHLFTLRRQIRTDRNSTSVKGPRCSRETQRRLT
jgi:hypothetical protein